jgi:hypothetical protein
MTSNGEREFSPAFLRRCIQLELRQPDMTKLESIVHAHLPDHLGTSADIIDQFLERKTVGELATDQLLNAIYLANLTRACDREALARGIMPNLCPPPAGSDAD